MPPCLPPHPASTHGSSRMAPARSAHLVMHKRLTAGSMEAATVARSHRTCPCRRSRRPTSSLDWCWRCSAVVNTGAPATAPPCRKQLPGKFSLVLPGGPTGYHKAFTKA